MVKIIFFTSVVSVVNVLPVFSQTVNNANINLQPATDYSIQVPEDLENNFDQLLVDWRAKNKNSSANCFADSDMEYFYPDSTYINRIYNLPTKMELVYNRVVRSYIDMYATKRKAGVPILLAKSNYYFPIIEKYLDQYQIPLELQYLPIVESALNPTVVSRAGATGLWQFMIGTARMYDLEINSLVDERRDPVKSSEAAARYLRDLYNIYNDWTLVIAAYNCGPGNVNKAIKRSGGQTDYWKIYNFLPKETRGYVPAFIAATYIMNYPEKHGICPVEYDYFASIDTIHVTKQLNMNHISEVLDIPIEDLRDLNPQYKSDIIPGSYQKYVLRLPSLKAIDFIAQKEKIYKENDQYLTHRKVVEPNGGQSTSKTYASSSNNSKVRHKVRRGDNLLTIASKYQVSVKDIKKWNGLKSDKIRVGQVLAVGGSTSNIDNHSNQNKRSEIASAATPKKTGVSSSSQSKNSKEGSSLLSQYFAQVRAQNATEVKRQ